MKVSKVLIAVIGATALSTHALANTATAIRAVSGAAMKGTVDRASVSVMNGLKAGGFNVTSPAQAQKILAAIQAGAVGQMMRTDMQSGVGGDTSPANESASAVEAFETAEQEAAAAARETLSPENQEALAAYESGVTEAMQSRAVVGEISEEMADDEFLSALYNLIPVAGELADVAAQVEDLASRGDLNTIATLKRLFAAADSAAAADRFVTYAVFASLATLVDKMTPAGVDFSDTVVVRGGASETTRANQGVAYEFFRDYKAWQNGEKVSDALIDQLRTGVSCAKQAKATSPATAL